MNIISPKRISKFMYAKFSAGFIAECERIGFHEQFEEERSFFISLQQYEESKEWIIWFGSDLFAEIYFDDVWLIFQSSEATTARMTFENLIQLLSGIDHKTNQQKVNVFIDQILVELETELHKMPNFQRQAA